MSHNIAKKTFDPQQLLIYIICMYANIFLAKNSACIYAFIAIASGCLKLPQNVGQFTDFFQFGHKFVCHKFAAFI